MTELEHHLLEDPTPMVRIVNTLGQIVGMVATLSTADNFQGSFSQKRNMDVDAKS